MTVHELKEAIKRTRDEIWELKRQLKEIVDIRERRAIERRLQELQCLQLWHLNRLGWNLEILGKYEGGHTRVRQKTLNFSNNSLLPKGAKKKM